MKKVRFMSVMALASLLTACAPHYSEGSRMGIVTKLSYKGIFFKSWEGQLNQGGMSTDSEGNVVPNVLSFNVSDPSVIAKVKEAARSGKRVELVYNQWLITPLTIGNSHVVVDVREAQ